MRASAKHSKASAKKAGNGANWLRPPSPPAWPADPLRSLIPGISNESRQALELLHAHADEIQAWFVEDPERVRALQDTPYQTLSQLSHALSLTIPSALPENLPSLTVLRNPLECVCGPPSPLYVAVWQYIGQSAANLASWSNDPIALIRQVAASTTASAQDLDSLIYAFERLLAQTINASGALAQGSAATQRNQVSHVMVKQR